jgi:diadenosine tetraphosphate (Ap4A) HIT family hydrolase
VSLYFLGNARTPEQVADMQRLEDEGRCLFCPDQLESQQRLLHRTEHWMVTPNKYPYRGTRMHVMLLPDEHVDDLADLSEAAQRDFWRVLDWVKVHYGLKFYGMVVRNGLSEYTGGTVRHVHVHILQGDIDDPEHEPVRVKLSSVPGSDIDPDQLHLRSPQDGVPVQ